MGETIKRCHADKDDGNTVTVACYTSHTHVSISISQSKWNGSNLQYNSLDEGVPMAVEIAIKSLK